MALDPDVFFLLLLPPLLFLDGWLHPQGRPRRDADRRHAGIGAGGLHGAWHRAADPLVDPRAAAGGVHAGGRDLADPIAVSAIAGQTPLPLRMPHLEGEALFNDASGLVCMRFAVAAALTGSFGLSQALLDFLWVASGGLGVGFAVTWLVTRARSSSPSVLVGDDGGAQILASVLIPFGVYLLAEALHCSGILAAVAAGITMGHSPHAHWQAVTRIRRTAVYTLQLLANGSVFVLLGEQIPSILAGAGETVLPTGHHNPWWSGWASSSPWLLRVGLGIDEGRLPGHAVPRADVPRPAVACGGCHVGGGRAGRRHAGRRAHLAFGAEQWHTLSGRDLAIFLAAGVILMSLLVATVLLPRALRGVVLRRRPVSPRRNRPYGQPKPPSVRSNVPSLLAASTSQRASTPVSTRQRRPV